MHKVLYSNDDLNLTDSKTLASSNITVTAESLVYEQMLAAVVTLSCFSVFGCAGNGLVILVYGRLPIKDSSKIFILALACIDMFACVALMPFTAVYLYLNFQLKFDALCKLYQFLISSDIPLSAFLMVTIAFDRYFCICHPFLRLVTPKRAKLILIIPILTACCLGSINSFSQGVSTYVDIVIPSEASSKIETLSVGFCSNSSSLHQTCIKENEDQRLIAFGDCTFPCYNASLTKQLSVNTTMSTEIAQILIYTNGYCILSSVWYHVQFFYTFQKIYASFFLVSLIVVFGLYIKIYHFVSRHRSLLETKRDRGYAQDSFDSMATEVDEKNIQLPKTRSLQTLSSTVSLSLICHPIIGVMAQRPMEMTYGYKTRDNKKPPNRVKRYMKKVKSLQDVRFAANVRTAATLAVVAVVYTVCFLPGWLMAIRIIPYQMNIFYLYFMYNVANPVIYAFMNPTFRKEMKLAVRKHYK